MKEEFYISLLVKQLKGEINPSEQRELDEWAAAAPENQATVDDLTNAWLESDQYRYFEPAAIDLGASFDSLLHRIQTEELPQANTALAAPLSPLKVEPREKGIVRVWRVAAAAVVALALVAGWYSYSNNTPTVQWVAFSTAAGETKELTLADGTQITLNQNSTLSYPEAFTEDTRPVKLEGEAFFRVTHDEQHPFTVQAAGAEVRVLGTAFDVRAYGQEQLLAVTVENGKVRVTPDGSKNNLTLTAGQKGIYDLKNRSLRYDEDKALNAVAWKTGKLSFNAAPINKVIQEIESHFGIKVNLTGDAPVDCPYTSEFFRADAPAILQSVAAVFHMTLEKTGERSYSLSGGKCE